MTKSRAQIVACVVVIVLLASVLQVNRDEMKRKLWTIKKIVNQVTTSIAAPNALQMMEFVAIAIKTIFKNSSTASKVAMSCLKWMGIVDGCITQQTNTRAVACMYMIMACMVLLQDWVNGDPGQQKLSNVDKYFISHEEEQDIKRTNCHEVDDVCFYDCSQTLEDFTFMPATTSSETGRNGIRGQSDLGHNSDSYWLAVDNCCTSCISNCLSDFVRPMTKIMARVRGVGGVQVVVTMKGVLKWHIADDDGRIHTFLIKDSYYHQTSPYQLLSPQHLAQTCFDDERGTWCGTYRDGVDLHWDHGQYKKSIPFNSSNIVLMLQLQDLNHLMPLQQPLRCSMKETAGHACQLQSQTMRMTLMKMMRELIQTIQEGRLSIRNKKSQEDILTCLTAYSQTSSNQILGRKKQWHLIMNG
jgi:hypothetical protein